MTTPTCGELSCDECDARTATLTAERDQLRAEVERLTHLETVLRSSAADMTTGRITAGGVAELRAEVERLKTCGITELAAINPSMLDYCKHWEARAERAEAELATERARLDWLEGNAGDIPKYNSCSFIWFANQNIRAAIDAGMKEGAK